MMTTLEQPATTIVPLAGNIGAEVRGLRLDTLSDADVASIRGELYRHGVLAPTTAAPTRRTAGTAT